MALKWWNELGDGTRVAAVTEEIKYTMQIGNGTSMTRPVAEEEKRRCAGEGGEEDRVRLVFYLAHEG